ncbi:MAG: Zn-dependent hydrolase [Candidatus Aminicenantes bacterium RBG_19FT_COMBO_65_30]|nr:MAG: Zn-dependent hydrolase [Candidatus Aminicenantes bacterium RBG_19FT_COMBO_65_30]
MDIWINGERLRKDLEELGRIGRDEHGGVSRPSFSPADFEARAWLKRKIEEAGLCYRQDGAGNQFGRVECGGKTVMAGSHIDTVPNGGMFDGAAGVVAALEAARRIIEEKVPLSKPLEVASFTDEEGNLVGDFLGSRAFMGLLDENEIRNGKTSFGLPFRDVLKRTEFTAGGILAAHKDRPGLEAYVELHIEQGPVLEDEGLPIGIVERIAGKHYRQCAFVGESGHAGTTPLELRHDAFLGLADLALKATQHVATRHYGSMLTVGKAALHPGSFSVIPGRADFTLEFRSASPEALAAIEKEVFALAEDIASTRGLRFVSRVVDKTAPVTVAPRLVSLMEEECRVLGYPSMRMTSGAGHDAQILAGACDAGLIFIPSPDGVSHAPGERVVWDDLEKGANLLLRTLVRLGSQEGVKP